MNTITNGQEIPDGKKLKFSRSVMLQDGEEHFRIMVKSGYEPLIEMPRFKLYSAVQIFKIENGNESEVFHELFDKVLTESQADTAIENIKQNFKSFVGDYGKKVDYQTKHKDQGGPEEKV